MIAVIDYFCITRRSDTCLWLHTKGGVGYEVITPNAHALDSDELGGTCHGHAFIHHHITERGQTLYAFSFDSDVDMFRDLLTVNGVGPSAAIKIMGDYTIDKIRIDIADGDADDLAKAKGIGKKTAEKIVVALKEKYKEYTTKTKAPDVNPVRDTQGTLQQTFATYIEMAIQGMLKLGYKQSDAKKKVDAVSGSILTNLKLDNATLSVPSGDDLVATLITNALKA